MSFSENQEEAKSLIEEQGKLVKQFREEVVSKIKNQEDKVKTYVSEKDAKMQGRMDEIEERISVLTGPDGSLKSDESDSEEMTDLYSKYIRKGFSKFDQADSNRLGELVTKSYETKGAGDPVLSYTDGSGGFLVPEEFFGTILNNFQEVDPMRAEADVIQISGNQIDFHTGFDAAAGWEAESFEYHKETAPDAANPSFSRKTIKAESLMGQVRISQEALEDIPNIAGYITQRLATKMAYAEGNAFLHGDGSNKPQGFDTGTNQTLMNTAGNSVVMASSTKFDFDEFFELQGKFKTGYQNNLKWFFNLNTLAQLRKVQATGGEYLWQGALGGADGGHPATIAGRPYAILPSLTDLSNDRYSVYCGDMKQAYKIIQKVGVSVARLNEFQYPDILFIARTRVGGDLVLPEALGYMKGAS